MEVRICGRLIGHTRRFFIHHFVKIRGTSPDVPWHTNSIFTASCKQQQQQQHPKIFAPRAKICFGYFVGRQEKENAHPISHHYHLCKQIKIPNYLSYCVPQPLVAFAGACTQAQ
jgi:hypothetical protein